MTTRIRLGLLGPPQTLPSTLILYLPGLTTKNLFTTCEAEPVGCLVVVDCNITVSDGSTQPVYNRSLKCLMFPSIRLKSLAPGISPACQLIFGVCQAI